MLSFPNKWLLKIRLGVYVRRTNCLALRTAVTERTHRLTFSGPATVANFGHLFIWIDVGPSGGHPARLRHEVGSANRQYRTARGGQVSLNCPLLDVVCHTVVAHLNRWSSADSNWIFRSSNKQPSSQHLLLVEPTGYASGRSPAPIARNVVSTASATMLPDLVTLCIIAPERIAPIASSSVNIVSACSCSNPEALSRSISFT